MTKETMLQKEDSEAFSVISDEVCEETPPFEPFLRAVSRKTKRVLLVTESVEELDKFIEGHPGVMIEGFSPAIYKDEVTGEEGVAIVIHYPGETYKA